MQNNSQNEVQMELVFQDSFSENAEDIYSDDQSYEEIREPLGNLEVLGDMMQIDSRPVEAELNLLYAEDERFEIRELGTQTILTRNGPPVLISMEHQILEQAEKAQNEQHRQEFNQKVLDVIQQI